MEDSKKKSGKKRQPITIDMKKQIIKKYEEGVTLTQLAHLYDRSKSTINTIVKDKDKFKAATASHGITKLVKSRNSVTDEMENLLMVWIRDRQRAGDSISESFICEKARKIYDELRADASGASTSAVGDFVASKGWFSNFRTRMGLKSVVRHGEAASSDVSAAKEYLEVFENIIEEGGYVPQQVFNCDETGLFWKKLPKRTYITKEEASLPGHKPMKDRLTLMMCANASGDLKIKPLLVYHSENPRAFKHISKSELGVLWRSNQKAWVTRILFTQWMKEVFCPSVRDYLKEKNLPMKALLVMDNAPAHPPDVMEDLPLSFRFVQVHFLPPNTTPLLQPMDQQVISNFKKKYTREMFRMCFEKTSDGEMTVKEFWKKSFNIADAVVLIVKAWKEVSQRCLRAAWRKLWPDAAPERDFEGFEDKQQEILQEIVTLGNSMGLDVDATDLEDLVQEHKEELTTQELQEMHQEEHEERQRVLGSDEDEEEKEKLDQAGLKALFAAWNTVKETLYKHHPDFARTQELMNQVDDECMTFFWETQKRRLKQSTMDKFFTKVIRKASQDNQEYESPAKKSKIEAEGEPAEGDHADSDDPDDPSISSTTMSGGDF